MPAPLFTRFVDRVFGPPRPGDKPLLRLTRGQRALARVAFDGAQPKDLPPEERELARTIFGNADTVPRAALARLVLRCGRGSGKSLLAAAFVIYCLLFVDVSRCGPGDEACGIVIAPTRDLAQIAFNAGSALLRGAPALAPLIVHGTRDSITLRRPDGKLVVFRVVPRSAGGKAARGRSFVAVIFDESEFLPASTAAATVTDTEVISAVGPRMLPGGPVILASTPWPAVSMTAELFDQNFGAPKHALCARAPTLLLRDHRPDLVAQREADLAHDANKALREWDCELTDADGAYFEASNVDRAISAEIVAMNTRATAGIDLAFRSDSSALVITERQADRLVVVHIALRTPKPGRPLKPSDVVSDFAKRAREAGATEFVADGHYIESAREHASTAGLTVVAGPPDKEASFVYLRDLFREGRIVVPLHPQLLGQLKSVLGVVLPGGATRIVLPRRAGAGHADLVSALVAAAHHDKRHGPLLRKAVRAELPVPIQAGYQWR